MVVAYILSWLNVLGYFCAYQNDVIDANRAFAFFHGAGAPLPPLRAPILCTARFIEYISVTFVSIVRIGLSG